MGWGEYYVHAQKAFRQNKNKKDLIFFQQPKTVAGWK